MDTKLAKAIRSTITYLQTKKGGWVRISDLRDWLDTDATAEEVDEAILSEYREHHIRLTSEANRRTLNSYDKATAVNIGGEPQHWIALTTGN
jgi:hypothetical protein